MCKRPTAPLLALTAFIAIAGSVAAVATAADLHDPTRPDTTVAPAPGVPVAHFVVSAIFVSDDRRVAIINGTAVTAGDRIGGATVQTIDAHTVTLRYRNKIIHTHLSMTKVRE